jgi:hypothetical protein
MPVPFSTLFNIEQPRSEIGVELRLINKDDLGSAPQTASTSTPTQAGQKFGTARSQSVSLQQRSLAFMRVGFTNAEAVLMALNGALQS